MRYRRRHMTMQKLPPGGLGAACKMKKNQHSNADRQSVKSNKIMPEHPLTYADFMPTVKFWVMVARIALF